MSQRFTKMAALIMAVMLLGWFFLPMFGMG